MVLAPPLITNEALSSSAMSVIAYKQTEKYTDLFGYDWANQAGWLAGVNAPMQTVKVNPADIGRPPPPLSYYFGAAGWFCLNANPYEREGQPITASFPPGMPCDTIFDDYYLPWIQIPSTVRTDIRSTCNLMFGWDPPVALTEAVTVSGPSTPTKVPATTCLLYTSPSPRDGLLSRMPSSA